jgi:hypothetical protein
MKRPRCARVRVGPTGFLDGTSLYRRETRALPVRAPAGSSSAPPPLHTGLESNSNSKGECADLAAAPSTRHPGERRDPALALDLALGSRRWRRAAQPDVGERRDCLRPWMAEFRAGRRPASSAGYRSGFIGSAPASGRLSLGYLSLAKQRKVTRTPKADETGRETPEKPRIPSSHRDSSRSIEAGEARPNPRGRAFRRSYRKRSKQTDYRRQTKPGERPESTKNPELASRKITTNRNPRRETLTPRSRLPLHMDVRVRSKAGCLRGPTLLHGQIRKNRNTSRGSGTPWLRLPPQSGRASAPQARIGAHGRS